MYFFFSSSFLVLGIRASFIVMPRQRQQQQLGNRIPLLFSSLSNRQSSYLTWLVILSTPTPHVIKQSDLGNEVADLLLLSYCALPVPPMVNDIASALSWLVDTGPTPLFLCHYKTIAHNLLYICEGNSYHYIHPVDAHWTITLICMKSLLYDCYPWDIIETAYEAVREYITTRWGDRIQYAGFSNILSDSYMFMKRNYRNGMLFFREP
jgi:hypothetical protein